MKTWSYFQNPFLNAVKGNYKKALKVSTFHDNALKELSIVNVAFVPMYNTYHALHLVLVSAYAVWKASGGTHKGATLTLNQLITLLSPTKINAWDAAIQAVYAKGSAGYVTLLPQGHTPFWSGTIQERIHAVEALSSAIGSNPSLIALKSDVDAFALLLNNALSVQGGDEMSTELDTLDVRNAVNDCMVQQYSNLGTCIQDHPKEMPDFEFLWDLETVRNHEQVLFTGTLAGDENHPVLTHTFAATDELQLTATETALQFYLATSSTAGPAGYTLIDVPAGTTVTITASAFGTLNRFLHVVNTEGVEGHFKVQL